MSQNDLKFSPKVCAGHLNHFPAVFPQTSPGKKRRFLESSSLVERHSQLVIIMLKLLLNGVKLGIKTTTTAPGASSGDLRSQDVVRVFLDGRSGFASAWSQRGEAGRGGEGDAAQAHVQAVDLGGDRHLREEGAIPGQASQPAAAPTTIAALDVFDDVEDLLTLRLPSHPPDVQNGRHVLLPETQRGGEGMQAAC